MVEKPSFQVLMSYALLKTRLFYHLVEKATHRRMQPT
jgi:hypothetical protein